MKKKLKDVLESLPDKVGFTDHRGYFFLGDYKEIKKGFTEICDVIDKIKIEQSKMQSGTEKYKCEVALKVLENTLDEGKYL